MHHSKPITSSCGRCTHSQHNPCPTELTSCGEGSMKGWQRMVGRHNPEEKYSLGSEQGGAFPCTTPNP